MHVSSSSTIVHWRLNPTFGRFFSTTKILLFIYSVSTFNLVYAIDVIPTPYVHCISEQDIAELARTTEVDLFKETLIEKVEEGLRCSVIPIGVSGVRVTDITQKLTDNGQKYYCYRLYDSPDRGENDCVLSGSIKDLQEHLSTTTDGFVIEFNNNKLAFAKCLNGTTVIVDKATPKTKLQIKFNYMGIDTVEKEIGNSDIGQSIRDGCIGKGLEFQK
jgi:hypothetical protein